MSHEAFGLARPYIVALKASHVSTVGDLLTVRHLLVSPSTTPRFHAQAHAQALSPVSRNSNHVATTSGLPALPTPLQLAIDAALQHIVSLGSSGDHRRQQVHRALTGRGGVRTAPAATVRSSALVGNLGTGSAEGISNVSGSSRTSGKLPPIVSGADQLSKRPTSVSSERRSGFSGDENPFFGYSPRGSSHNRVDDSQFDARSPVTGPSKRSRHPAENTTVSETKPQSNRRKKKAQSDISELDSKGSRGSSRAKKHAQTPPSKAPKTAKGSRRNASNAPKSPGAAARASLKRAAVRPTNGILEEQEQEFLRRITMAAKQKNATLSRSLHTRKAKEHEIQGMGEQLDRMLDAKAQPGHSRR